MKPTIGRIVIYNTKEKDPILSSEPQFPAIIIKVHNSNTVDLKVFGNGPYSCIYRPNITQGDEPGEWNWPVIQK